jgi:hypothetical protein
MKVYAVQSVDGSALKEVYTLCVFETESLAREYVKKHLPKYQGSGNYYLQVRSWNVLNRVE